MADPSPPAVQGRTLTSGFVVGAVASGLALTAVGTTTDHSPASRPAATPAPAQAVPVASPLAFERNAGRTDRRVRYLTQGPGYSVFLTDRGATLASRHGDVLQTTVAGAAHTRPTAERRLRGVINDYRDGRSIAGLHTFGRVRYSHVYPGIDLVYHGRQGLLEYDFDVSPAADVGRIALRLRGQRRLSLAANGDLLIHSSHGTLRQHRPVAFQRIGSRKVPVDAAYEVAGDRVRFRVGDYDKARLLVIDPVLSYSSYLGGSAGDTPEKVALGLNNSVVVTGNTTSNDFPKSPGRSSGRTDADAFVTSFDSDGTPVWTTYLGGTGIDAGHDVAVDSSGRVYVVGETTSTGIEFTTTPLPALDTCADSTTDAFIARLFGDGTMSYLSCFGGNGVDVAYGIALRNNVGGAIAYITGSTTSTDFTAPTGAKAPFQASNAGNTDAFLAQVGFAGNTCSINGPCVSFPYRTYLGGTGDDLGRGVALYSTLGAYITGSTGSTNFPVTIGSDSSGASFYDAFIAKFDTSTTNPGTNRVYSRYYGGLTASGSTAAYAIGVDSSDNAYIAGESAASDLYFPLNSKNTGVDGFIGRVDPNGTAISSDYIGSPGTDRLYDMALQDNGAALVIGKTTDQPATQNPVPNQSCSAGNYRVFVGKFSAGANPQWIYASCIGGSQPTIDIPNGIAAPSSGADGSAWITGNTLSFPTVNAAQSNFGGGASDGFLAHLVQRAPNITDGPSGIIATNSAQFTFSTPDSDMGFECSTPDGSHRLVAGSRSKTSCDLSGTTATYSGLAEGDHTFEVATVDDVGAKSAPVSRQFTVDTVPPGAFDLSAPGDGETTGTTPTFSWTAATDGTALTYQVFVDDKKLQDVPDSACASGTCSATAASALSTGAHKWRVTAVDAVGHSTNSGSTRTFTVIDPPKAHLTVSPNPVLAGNTVTFDGSGSADATHSIAKYEWDLDGDGTYERDTGTAATTTNSYATAQTVTVGLRVTDAGGSTGTTTAELKVTTSPTGSGSIGVSINKGAQYTNKPKVTLTIVAPAGTTALLVANDGGFAGALPQALSKELDWTLDSSGPERLPKTVYVRFLTGPFASPNYTDDIILDERPPVVDSASVAGAPPSAASAAKLKTFKVKVKAHDTNSGVGFVQVTANKRKPGKLIKYKKSVKAKLATRPKFLRARDRAGNYSRWKKLR